MARAIRDDIHGTLKILGATALVLLSLGPVAYFALKRNKPKVRRTQTQYSSRQFVLAAGAIPFVLVDGLPNKVLLVHKESRNEWLLAKGKKDDGEELAAAATREVLEETGYRCHLLPVPHLPTRATIPGQGYSPDVVRFSKDGTEPFAIAIRPDSPGVKLIFWYIGYIEYDHRDANHVAPVGTHMAAEGYDKTGIFDVEEALTTLTFEGDRDLVRMAVGLFKNNN